MSFKHSVIASVANQVYNSLIGIVVLPLYIRFLGIEAYGLIGFFSTIQICFSLLDLGMTPMLSRETVRFISGVTEKNFFYQLVKTLRFLFFMTGLILIFLLFLLSDQITHSWLKTKVLSFNEVKFSVQAMVVCAGLRWICGFYRGIITGTEQLVWLNSFNIIINTCRFVLVLLVLQFFSATPSVFFSYQVCVAIFELVFLSLKTGQTFPELSKFRHVQLSLKPFKALFNLSISIALTSFISLMITQSDKLILSKILSLDEYGYFSFSVQLTSSILLIASAVASVILPRITRLEAEGNRVELVEIYRKTTKIVVHITFSLVCLFVFFPRQLILAWTGNTDIAFHITTIMQLYAIGNGIFVISAFPYYLQYAAGRLNLHFIGNIFLAISSIPIVYILASRYGAVGSGCGWVFLNTLYFMIWVPFVHKKFIPKIHMKWFFEDIFFNVVKIILFSLCYQLIGLDLKSRISSMIYLTFFVVMMLVIYWIDSSRFNKNLMNQLLLKYLRQMRM